jgi:hypothetical protein
MAVLTYTFTRTHNAIIFADPYKKCEKCGRWVDGVLDAPGPTIVIPCEHRAEYRDLCPSWGPVDGCTCPDDWHKKRTPEPRDGKVY